MAAERLFRYNSNLLEGRRPLDTAHTPKAHRDTAYRAARRFRSLIKFDDGNGCLLAKAARMAAKIYIEHRVAEHEHMQR